MKSKCKGITVDRDRIIFIYTEIIGAMTNYNVAIIQDKNIRVFR